MDCPYVLSPLAQFFGYDLDRRYTYRPKSYRFNRPRPLRSKSNKSLSSINRPKSKNTKTILRNNSNPTQAVNHKTKNTPRNNRSLSDNVISSSSGKRINTSKTSNQQKPSSSNPNCTARRKTSRKTLETRDSISSKNKSETIGLFPYLLNSIRESKSDEERSYSYHFSDRPYGPRRNLGYIGRIIYTLNLPENQIPQTSNHEPHFIPSVSSSVIFGQGNNPEDDPKISTDDPKISTDDPKISTDDPKISTDEPKSEDSPVNPTRQENKYPKQLIPISKMLKEKSGLGPEIIDLDHSLHGLRIREMGSIESNESIWSARNSVRDLLTEIIGPYEIPSKKLGVSPVIKTEIKRDQTKNNNVISVPEKPQRKLKGILKPPTPRFYYDKMKDRSEDNIIHKSDKIDRFPESLEFESAAPSNYLSERRVQVDKLIGDIADDNG